MDYKITTTKGFVLSVKKAREYDRRALIFSRELGLIVVHARGIDKTGAKLRGFFNRYNFATFSFIHGKELLLKEASNTKEKIDFTHPYKRKAVFHISNLITTYLPMSIPTDKIFDNLVKNLEVISQAKDKKTIRASYLIFYRTLLQELGYVEKDQIQETLLEAIEKITSDKNVEKRLREEIREISSSCVK